MTDATYQLKKIMSPPAAYYPRNVTAPGVTFSGIHQPHFGGSPPRQRKASTDFDQRKAASIIGWRGGEGRRRPFSSIIHMRCLYFARCASTSGQPQACGPADPRDDSLSCIPRPHLYPSWLEPVWAGLMAMTTLRASVRHKCHAVPVRISLSLTVNSENSWEAGPYKSYEQFSILFLVNVLSMERERFKHTTLSSPARSKPARPARVGARPRKMAPSIHSHIN